MKKQKLLFLSFIVFLVAFASVTAVKIKAGSGDNTTGWLWGGTEEVDDGNIDGNETGLFKVSISSSTCDSDNNNSTDVDPAVNNNCPPIGTPVVGYGVNIPSGDGDLSGYAWSENVGWISFNSADLSGCPSGSCSANISYSGGIGNISGWARFVGIAQESAVGNSGGWEGWISLDDKTGNSYGVSIDSSSGESSGYAWSASTSGLGEFGWIDFSNAIVGTVEPEPSCEPSETEFTYDCTNGSSACGPCGSEETTNPWICHKFDSCGGSSTTSQQDCFNDGRECTETVCPACSPASGGGNWRETAP